MAGKKISRKDYLPLSQASSSTDQLLDPSSEPMALPNEIEGSDVDVKSVKSINSLKTRDALFTRKRWWARSTFTGAILFNFVTFVLPALYSTLSKLWVANIDSSLVATTDSYTYAQTVTEVINEGLPRAAYLLIGNSAGRSLSERLTLSCTLVAFQMVLGFLLSCSLLAAAPSFAATFVPKAIVKESIRYVRIAAFGSLFSATSTSVAAATRSLDRPDIPLLISMSTVSLNIVLDFIFLSTFRPVSFQPTVNTQATIQLICNGIGAVAGLVYFVWTIKLLTPDVVRNKKRTLFSFKGLILLGRAGGLFFTESAIRNALYLFLTSTIIALGADWATAWGVFNTIRWGLIMVPVQTLEATALVFDGHRFGRWCNESETKRASWDDLLYIASPSLSSIMIAVVVETFMCLLLTFRLIHPFAKYLSNNEQVADIVTYIWKSMDWMYIVGYAVSELAADLLTSTRPILYLGSSLMSNLLYVLPWAIAVNFITIHPNNEWMYYKWIFGGSLLVSDVTVGTMLIVWVSQLRKGKLEGVIEKGLVPR